VCVCLCVCTEREREREREAAVKRQCVAAHLLTLPFDARTHTHKPFDARAHTHKHTHTHTHTHTYIHTYIYIYIYIYSLDLTELKRYKKHFNLKNTNTSNKDDLQVPKP